MSNIDFKIELEGFKELDKLLKTLPTNIQKRVLQSAVTGAIREGRKEIKASSPKSVEQSPASLLYGRLNTNLKVKRLKRTRRTEKGARIDTGRAFWAVWYELGNRRQAARPFFVPAFMRAKEKIIDSLRVRLKAGIEKEVKKLR